jgi:hypothetical protein
VATNAAVDVEAAVDAVAEAGVEDVPKTPTAMSAVPKSSNMMQIRTTTQLTLARN